MIVMPPKVMDYSRLTQSPLRRLTAPQIILGRAKTRGLSILDFLRELLDFKVRNKIAALRGLQTNKEYSERLKERWKNMSPATKRDILTRMGKT
ncbi:MAG: hypothetical protein V1494_00210 [Candidatus Diapherotrites archaeon]